MFENFKGTQHILKVFIDDGNRLTEKACQAKEFKLSDFEWQMNKLSLSYFQVREHCPYGSLSEVIASTLIPKEVV